MSDQVLIPRILIDAILKYLDSKPASKEARALARLLRHQLD